MPLSLSLGLGLSSRNTGGGVPDYGYLTPYFEFDLDAGVYVFNGSTYASFDLLWAAVSGTYTRAGTKKYIGADGLLTSAGANVWPTEYDSRDIGRLVGKTSWPNGTTRHTFGRDFTNAVWAKTNVAAALDQTGIDGGSNAASSLLATSANGTCLQAITDAARHRGAHCFVKRLIGTGTVEFTVDGGTTWVNVTDDLATTGWFRCFASAFNYANPSVGFRLGTSGDKIAVDYAQVCDGLVGAAPLLAGETSSADVATIALANLPGWNFSAGGFALKSANLSPGGGASALSIDDGTSNEAFVISKASNGVANYSVTDGGVSQAAGTMGGAGASANYTFKSAFWAGLRYKANAIRPAAEGDPGTLDSSATLPTPTHIRLGAAGAFGGAISGFRVFNAELSDNDLTYATSGTKSGITWGDSLSIGAAATVGWKGWPWLIRRRSSSFLSTTVIRGVGSTTSGQALTAMTAATIGRRFCNLIWTGHNDNGVFTAAETLANIAAMYALVPRCIVATVLIGPSDDAGQIARKNTINASILATYGSKAADINQAVIDGGGASLFADTIHLNDAGQLVARAKFASVLNALGW